MIEKGAKVRIKDSEIDFFLKSFANRVRGRVGIVTGHTWGGSSDHPIVTFPAQGRKKEYRAGRINERWLEVVEEAAGGEDK